MNSQTANECSEQSTKRQKMSENNNSNGVSSIIEASTDEQVAGPSNVHRRKSDGSGESAATDTIVKKDTLNYNIDEDEAVDDSNIDAPIVQQTTDILKLDIDCFEEAFDYLPLQELIFVGETCKRLQQVAGYCFHQNYSHDEVNACPQVICTELAYFIPFIRKITINDIKELEYFLQSQSKFHRLMQITMNGFDLTREEIDRLLTMAIWSKLEVICVKCCDLINNFQKILNLCTNVKRLEIHRCTREYNWFDRKYPTLEYLKFDHWHRESFKGIPRFLELNPNIRKFATTYSLLKENRDKVLTSNIKLDDLAIYFEYEVGSQFQSMCDLLNELHEHGFYTKLQLYTWEALQQEMINQLANVNDLNKLCIYRSRSSFSLSSLKNLEEIYLRNCDSVSDLEILPNELIHLKRIHFYRASFDAILPFIRRSAEMQRIRVDELRAGAHFNEDTEVIDLRALNKDREKLSDAARSRYMSTNGFIWPQNGHLEKQTSS